MFLKQIFAAFIALAIVSGGCSHAYAGVITTQQALSADMRAQTEQQVRTALAREDVRQIMQDYGVAPADVDARIASLSDAELLQVQSQVEGMPAGGDIIWLVGLVFVVLIILELVGAIDIFKKG